MNILAKDLDHILEHTEGLWEELRGQHIFITGGTGFLGCWMLESLVWANDKLSLKAKVTVLTRRPLAFKWKAPYLAEHPCVMLFAGDVRSFNNLGKYSHILHLATDEGHRLTVEDPITMFNIIAGGTLHMLEFAYRCKVTKLLFTSSGLLSGYSQGIVSNPYTAGKWVAEQLCQYYAKACGVAVKIARIYSMVGAYLPLGKHFAIGNFIGDILNGNSIVVKGDGSPVRSYLYAADVAIWLWTILFKGDSVPYDVGSDKAVTIKELAELVAKTIEPPTRLVIMNGKNEGQERYIPNIKRAYNELGLRQHIDLPEAIKRTIEWYKGV